MSPCGFSYNAAGVAKDPLAIQRKWDSDATHVILEVNEDMC